MRPFASPQSRVWLLALIVSLGGFLFGFDASVISGAVPFVAEQWGLSDWQIGFLVSSPTMGAIVASLLVGPASDAIGRRRVLMLIAVLYTVSAAGSALAPNFTALVLARVLGGLAFGSLVVSALYIAEIAPAHRRGQFVSVNQFNIVIGFSASYFANYLLLKVSQSEAGWVHALSLADEPWRWMLGLELIPAVIFVVALRWVPETPRWLLLQNRTEEARKILNQIASTAEAAEMEREAIETRPASPPRWRERLAMLASPALRLPLIVGLIAAVAQQITGVNAVYFYAPTIFTQSGVGTDAAFAQSVWVGITNVVFTIIAIRLIDHLGRKILLLIGLAGVMISMSISGYGFSQATYQLTDSDSAALVEIASLEELSPLLGVTYQSDVAFKRALEEHLGEETARRHQSTLLAAGTHINATLVLVGILGFVASFAVSLGPVMWVLLSEIFPTSIRGLAISMVGLINSGVSFLVQLVFPWELNNLGAATTFMIYGGFAAIGFGLIAWLLPETKGRTLEQLEKHFQSTAKA